MKIGVVTISSLGSNAGSPGGDFSLTCSVTFSDNPVPSHLPSPMFEWLFGPNGNTSLPSGVTPTATLSSNGSTYTSTLQFSSLNLSHAGTYTCRLGAGKLANSADVTMNGILHYYNNVSIF